MDFSVCSGGGNLKKYRNTIEFEVYGAYALFSDPVMRCGWRKDKLSYSDL